MKSVAFQVFLTLKSFLSANYLMGFSKKPKHKRIFVYDKYQLQGFPTK